MYRSIWRVAGGTPFDTAGSTRVERMACCSLSRHFIWDGDVLCVAKRVDANNARC